MKINALELNPIYFDVNLFKKLSAKAFDLHHGKHHKGYVENLKKFNVPNVDVFELIEKSFAQKANDAMQQKIYNNACQHWNHSFFWNSLSVEAQSVPENVLNLILVKFQSFDAFFEAFYQAGAQLFGSGWVWIVFNYHSACIDIISTFNADIPTLLGPYQPLLVCDVWEHAYYVDYENRRIDFLKEMFHLFNWNFAALQLNKALHLNKELK